MKITLIANTNCFECGKIKKVEKIEPALLNHIVLCEECKREFWKLVRPPNVFTSISQVEKKYFPSQFRNRKEGCVRCKGITNTNPQTNYCSNCGRYLRSTKVGLDNRTTLR